jgi:hypothetical protein
LENGKAEWFSLERGGGRERGRRVNMVQILYTYVCKCKKLIQELGEKGQKRTVARVNSSMIYLINYKNLCKYSNIYPTQHNNNNSFKRD